MVTVCFSEMLVSTRSHNPEEHRDGLNSLCNLRTGIMGLNVANKKKNKTELCDLGGAVVGQRA
jgi:hypothetical protein